MMTSMKSGVTSMNPGAKTLLLCTSILHYAGAKFKAPSVRLVFTSLGTRTAKVGDALGSEERSDSRPMGHLRSKYIAMASNLRAA